MGSFTLVAEYFYIREGTSKSEINVIGSIVLFDSQITVYLPVSFILHFIIVSPYYKSEILLSLTR